MAHGDDRTIQEILSAEQAIRQRIAAEAERLRLKVESLRNEIEAERIAQEVELEGSRARFLAAARNEAATAAAAQLRQATAEADALKALDDATLCAALRRQLRRTLPAGEP